MPISDAFDNAKASLTEWNLGRKDRHEGELIMILPRSNIQQRQNLFNSSNRGQEEVKQEVKEKIFKILPNL